MRFSKTLLVGTALSGVALMGSPAWAGTCPNPLGLTGTSGETGVANGCNLTITFGANGTITTQQGSNTLPSPTSPFLYYDSGADDALVGVINNSGAPLKGFHIANPGIDILGFDADGIGAMISKTNASDGSNGKYGGQDAFFSNTNGAKTAGTVNFIGGFNSSGVFGANAGGIPNGQHGYFSLEQPISLNHIPQIGVPEPASMAMLGMGLAGLAAIRRRKRG